VIWVRKRRTYVFAWKVKNRACMIEIYSDNVMGLRKGKEEREERRRERGRREEKKI